MKNKMEELNNTSLFTPARFSSIFTVDGVSVGADKKDFVVKTEDGKFSVISKGAFVKYLRLALKRGIIDKETYDEYKDDSASGVRLFQGVNEMCVKKAVSFEKITIRESGMRVSQIYEIECGEKTTVSLYYPIYGNGAEEKRLEKTVTIETESMLDLLNEYHVLSWDGFYGKHPRGVLDGTMFSLDGKINDLEVSARGSQNFPRGYHDFMSEIYRIIRE